MTQKDEGKGDLQTYAVIGAAMEVLRILGCGFLEALYHEALAFEFTSRGISFEPEVSLNIVYRGRSLATTYRADFICFESIIVELKALAQLSTIEEAQVINYLNASRHERALLLNFGSPRLEFKRMVLSHPPLLSSVPSADP
jgi:GxxExxY protein